MIKENIKRYDLNLSTCCSERIITQETISQKIVEWKIPNILS